STSRCGTLAVLFCTPPCPSEIYTLSLHDALPICRRGDKVRAGRAPRARLAAPRGCLRRGARRRAAVGNSGRGAAAAGVGDRRRSDRKSTRLNSSHSQISYAVFCLKKKKNTKKRQQ